jgi:hypothetical protein
MQGNDLVRDTAGTARRWERTGGWTRRERLRVLWYRLRLTVQEMNYATRRLVELQAGVEPRVGSAGLARQQRPDDAGQDGLLTR